MRNLREYGFKSNNKVYVIAEIGVNHGGDIGLAKELIDSAAKTGADAVKFQTYTTEKRTHKGSPIFDILKKCELPYDAFSDLKDYTEKCGLEFFSTPFEEEAVDYLESIGCDMYKIASFDVVNMGLLLKIARTKKSVIMSVGMSNLEEIRKAYEILSRETSRISLLHCISAYPTRAKDANLAAIYKLKMEFDCLIGQSDHTDDITIPLYAVAAGAQVIEKHYRIDEAMDCVDAPVSITEREMKEMVDEIRRLEVSLGDGNLGIREAEKQFEWLRRRRD